MAKCKLMPVIPVNKMVDKNIIIGKRRPRKRRKRHSGSLTPKSIA
jgi:hypothetical protein